MEGDISINHNNKADREHHVVGHVLEFLELVKRIPPSIFSMVAGAVLMGEEDIHYSGRTAAFGLWRSIEIKVRRWIGIHSDDHSLDRERLNPSRLCFGLGSGVETESSMVGRIPFV